MAYPLLRSLNEDLKGGMIDGTYRNESPNRGGVVETISASTLDDLDPWWYGNRRQHPLPALPDGRFMVRGSRAS